jgi:hypothetical protein
MKVAIRILLKRIGRSRIFSRIRDFFANIPVGTATVGEARLDFRLS